MAEIQAIEVLYYASLGIYGVCVIDSCQLLIVVKWLTWVMQ